ncbi:hypothetical protein GCM10010946_13540 [Undibacterium squillarum]|uniref:Uncharacterized protein n=1 Tax=Undibacterium squillarum TaxID=1131567 RepID=A0ABQ2XWW4_9BURK|nr:hypothetical protein GCM10010946_13540 [Undibacterium squillarum]
MPFCGPLEIMVGGKSGICHLIVISSACTVPQAASSSHAGSTRKRRGRRALRAGADAVAQIAGKG